MSRGSWQKPISEISQDDWDVTVVGAGPAGSTAAAHLVESGMDVLLLDKQRFPRDKVCGDVIIPDAIECLKRLDLYEEVRSSGTHSERISAYSPSGHRVDVPGEFMALQRQSLDTIIAEGATRRGASCAEAEVSSITHHDGNEVISFNHSNRTVTSRIVLVATGSDISLLQNRGMVTEPQASAVAIRRYLQSDHSIDRMIVSLDRSVLPGYAWIFPLPDGVYNVGCGSFFDRQPEGGLNLKSMLDDFMTEFEPARELLSKGEWLEHVNGDTLRCGLEGTEFVDRERSLLAIGESVGATFPFSGEGIGKAMETAELASDAVKEAFAQNSRDPLSRYPSSVEAQLKPKYYGYEVAQEQIANPWFLDLLIQRGQRSSHIREAFSKIIMEEIDPHKILSWSGLFKYATRDLISTLTPWS